MATMPFHLRAVPSVSLASSHPCYLTAPRSGPTTFPLESFALEEVDSLPPRGSKTLPPWSVLEEVNSSTGC